MLLRIEFVGPGSMIGITHNIPLERDTLLPTGLMLLACPCFGTIPYFAKSLTDAGMAP
jgi:hypothetical protein